MHENEVRTMSSNKNQVEICRQVTVIRTLGIFKNRMLTLGSSDFHALLDEFFYMALTDFLKKSKLHVLFRSPA